MVIKKKIKAIIFRNKIFFIDKTLLNVPPLNGKFTPKSKAPKYIERLSRKILIYLRVINFRSSITIFWRFNFNHLRANKFGVSNFRDQFSFFRDLN
jgi:hypothetical protein